jgi:hypothetical protein
MSAFLPILFPDSLRLLFIGNREGDLTAGSYGIIFGVPEHPPGRITGVAGATGQKAF